MSALRAAIIGAGKIGRHHAKWYSRLGCQVVGFAVSHPDHIAPRTAELLQDCPALGPGFAAVDELLDTVQPDLVSVCSPADHHFAHARACLERGLPVLCEKPLVWAGDAAQILAEGRALVALAAEREALLAVNLQYTYAASLYAELVGDVGRPATCEVVLESRGKGAERTPAEVWMELGPHALSLVGGLLPGLSWRADSVTVETAPRTATAHFGLGGAAGEVACTVRCGQVIQGELTRRFGLNGRVVHYAGRNNAGGEFCTYLRCGNVETEYPDLMQVSIQRFVEQVRGTGVALVGGPAGLANLEAQVAVAGALG